jgi:hypothetical protein
MKTRVFTRETLDAVRCSTPGCRCEDKETFIGCPCNSSIEGVAPLLLVWLRDLGQLEARCGRCHQHALRFPVAGKESLS